MALTSKSMSYDSEWCLSDSRKISHDLLRLQWRVQDENNVSSSDQRWPNTLDESVSAKKILLLYAFQKSSLFFFPSPDIHLLAMDFFFLNITFWYSFSVPVLQCFFMLVFIILISPFTSMWPSPPSCLYSIPVLLMHFSFILSFPWVHCQIMA